MKLYHKKLSSLADLKRERYLMKYARNVHHLDDLLALNPKMGKKKKKKKKDDSEGDDTNPLSMAMGMLSGGAALKGFGFLGNKHVRKFFIKRIPRKSLARLAKEVFFGYLKWKAIELSYGIIVGAARKRKDKKRAQAAADAHHPIHQYSERDHELSRGYR